MSDNKPNPATNTLKLIQKPLAIVTDGHVVNIHNDNNGELIFFQISEKVGNELHAIGVTNIRMTVEQFKILKTVIENTLKDYEEKKQKETAKAKAK